MFLTEIKIKDDFRTLKSGTVIPLKNGINAICGDNGIGKTSLMDCLALNLKRKKDGKELFYDREIEEANILDVSYSDEKFSDYKVFKSDDNLKFKAYFVDDLDLQLSCMKSSMGESILLQIMKILFNTKDSIILLDEPDTSLSLKNRLLMGKIIKTLVSILNPSNQIIIVCHDIYFMQGLGLKDDVFNLELSKTQTVSEYSKHMVSKANVEFDAFLEKQGVKELIKMVKAMSEDEKNEDK